MKQNKILITGKDGMLAQSFQGILNKKGFEFKAYSRSELNIRIRDHIRRGIEENEPDILINCAAYTAVDKAESDPFHLAINDEAPGILAELCREFGVKLVHFSTDYVFSGSQYCPIPENEPTAPVNQYGQGKLNGERKIQSSGADFLIFRVQWLYSNYGKNFMKTVQRLLKEKKALNIVNDQWGKPTSCDFIAEVTLNAIDQGLRGLYHLGPSDSCTWFEFARICAGQEFHRVFPIQTKDYPTPAARPVYSVLSSEKLKRDLPNCSLLNMSWKKIYKNQNPNI
ncbi:MAG TPA: dTDP-4-dehydrorhamnose reductase [Leptospiraceae bacterium]|nr:dTDP-4-dehydrorhamnose reductase [Leptospiraceae bacterium]HNF15853.1 dTDP-4-dehydrorhamnose reductase [Leptospiraceae bacterium]HNF25567.1 dTDP-4-dehydrorhamnose reductase [Leptospiraceae bacterium]HNI98584.1 dTDP-4-dehydrorhamnose reductase [Leptospiraceae bacterium]HNM05880.1 dTDP-4-dehydrorhamnose reductase [Leptospiraceae bacterium]